MAGVGSDIMSRERLFPRALSLEEGSTAALVISRRRKKEGKVLLGFEEDL